MTPPFFLTLRLHSVPYEEKHNPTHRDEYERQQVHEREDIDAAETASDRGHDRQHDDKHQWKRDKHQHVGLREDSESVEEGSNGEVTLLEQVVCNTTCSRSV